MNLPIVTESSEISRLAERKFSVLLPGTWTVSTPKEGDDYGIDVTISIAADHSPTGRLAHVQLKGTRATDARMLTIRIKETTLTYLRSHADLATIVRVQVDQGRFWLVHLFDRRTQLTQDHDGYLNIHLSAEDEVSPAQVAERIDRLSYRVWLSMSSRAPFVVLVTPPDQALQLNTWLGQRIPLSMSFAPATDIPNPAHQFGIDLLMDGSAQIRDLASSQQSIINNASAGHFILGLADFLCWRGAPKFSASLIMRSHDLLSQQTIDTLDRSVHQYFLIEACAEHAADNEIATFIESTVATGAHWAAEWAVNFILQGRYIASTVTIDNIMHCLPKEGPMSLKLLPAKLYLKSHHIDAGRAYLRTIPVQVKADPADLFELGDLAEVYGDRDKARQAWRQAARNGYDRVACCLEISRSFVVEGRIAEAVRCAPRGGTMLDERCQALFTLLAFLRSIFKHASHKDRHLLDSNFGTDEGIKALIARLPADEQLTPVVNVLISALAIIIALRANADAGPAYWAKALEWAVRAKLPAAEIDSIIVLAAPRFGGDTLRIAAVALRDHPAVKVLAKHHKLIDQRRGIANLRRREDFISKAPHAKIARPPTRHRRK